MPKPFASLSLDLDNKWSYLKTHGDVGWEAYPSYLDTVVPRILDCCQRIGTTITFFVVGLDADRQENHDAIRAIAREGHEIASHSYRHEPWLHLYSRREMHEELSRAERALEDLTGQLPIGFRGPGFSFSGEVLQVLAERGYLYDASTFPTFIGPVARTYYFLTAPLTREERRKRKRLFGSFWEGLRPIRPYLWRDLQAPLVEIPVTTWPVLRIPIHLSYVIYLAQRSAVAARGYFRSALTTCRWLRIEPSILLHPLDFLGAEDAADLSFFPGMRMPGTVKRELVSELLRSMRDQFEVGTMRTHALRVLERES